MSDPGGRAQDQLHRFLFEDAPVRGGLVRLEETWRRVIARHEYPAPVAELLGEAVAATVLMTANLKGQTRVTLQLSGDGAIRLLVIQCSSALEVRAMVQWRDPLGSGGLLLGGRMAVTLEPLMGERYQGIVPVVGSSLAASLDAYFQRSEQLDTQLRLHADGDMAAGIMLQALPGEGADAYPHGDFRRLAARTVRIPPEDLHRGEVAGLLKTTFADRTVRLFRPQPVQHDCRCDAAHLSNIIRLLGADEINSIVSEQGLVELTCEFCNRAFRYGPEEAAAMLAGEDVPAQLIH